MKGLGRAGTDCLPVPNTAEIITHLWKKSTPTHTRTHTSLTETEDPLEDIAMIPDIGFEYKDLGENGIHYLPTCHNIARPNDSS